MTGFPREILNSDPVQLELFAPERMAPVTGLKAFQVSDAADAADRAAEDLAICRLMG